MGKIRRLFAVLTALFILAGSYGTVLAAATRYIDTVTVRIRPPVQGNELDLTPVVPSGSGYCITNVSWYNESDEVPASSTALAGRMYSLSFDICFYSGYAPASGCTVTINGNTVSASGHGNMLSVEGYRMYGRDAVHTIHLTAAIPVAGRSTDCGSVSNDIQYNEFFTVDQQRSTWREWSYTENRGYERSTFEGGKTYRLDACIIMGDLRGIASDCDVFVNGNRGELVYSGGNYYAVWYYTVYASITQVEITLSQPEMNDLCADHLPTVPQGANYSVASPAPGWRSGDIDDTDPVTTGMSMFYFPGTVSIIFSVVPKTGHSFADNVVCTINGSPCRVLEQSRTQLTLGYETDMEYDESTHIYYDASGTSSSSGSSGTTSTPEGTDRTPSQPSYSDPVAPSAPAASAGSGVSVNYATHVQNIGWQDYVYNGATAGTEGQSLRLEAMAINVDSDLDLGVRYCTHVQNIGWQDWVYDGAASGTEGLSYRLEGMKIELTGSEAGNYDIYYRVHVQNIGWMGWVSNGEMAGTEGQSLRLEGMQIKIVPKGTPINLVAYDTHVENIGWQSSVNDGVMSGTVGQSLRLEGIHITVNTPLGIGVEYRTHIQNIGWEETWRSNGEMSGTEGQSLRLEAIEIRLTGENASQYDIYYRTHVQNIGWTGWAANGGSSGSAGYSYRLEGIEILVVPAGSPAPGSTANAFYCA